MEQPGLKRKGKVKKGKKRKDRKKEVEATELQERLSTSSPESEQERAGLAETAFPVSGVVEDVGGISSVTKEPLKRSDSELTSIIVVDGKDESTRFQLAKDETKPDSEPVDSEPKEVVEESVTSPRRKATLSRLDSDIIQEEPAENVRYLLTK